jgi:hypothetical protein
MLWDMVWRGSFHRHIITSGGRRATPARTVRLSMELTFPAKPGRDTAKTQSMTALIDTS